MRATASARAWMALVLGTAALLLLLPVAQRITPVLPEAAPLGTARADLPSFRAADWFAGRLQADFEPWLADQLGLRSAMIRTANEGLALILGDHASRPRRLVFGQDSVLYDRQTVDAYSQPAPVAVDQLRAIARDLRLLQDSLRTRGIPFLVVIAPSKAEALPAHLPPGVAPRERGAAPGRRWFTTMLREHGVHHLDTPTLLGSWSEETGIPMFTRGGSHWNHWAAARVVAEMLDSARAQALRPMPTLRVVGAVTNDSVWQADNDLGGSLRRWTSGRWAGPQFHPVIAPDHPAEYTLDLLIVGDSFADALVNVLSEHRLLRAGEYRFYRACRYPLVPWNGRPYQTSCRPDPRQDLRATLSSRDLVVVEAVEPRLPEIGTGWLQRTLRALGVVPMSQYPAGRSPVLPAP